MPSCPATYSSRAAMSWGVMRLKENRWHRDRMVAGTLWSSVVARMNIRCSGGSSRIFSRALKAACGQHVDLVHDVYPLLHVGGGVDGLVPQGPDLVHAVVGGGVQLQHIQKAAVLDAHAGRALAAGVAVHRVLTVDGLGQDLGAGGLAGAPGAGEEVGVGGAALRHLLLQGLGDVGLADDVRERLGPPFAVQGLIQGTTSKRDFLRGMPRPRAHPHDLRCAAKNVLRMQLRNRHPRGTWKIPLNAARFPA